MTIRISSNAGHSNPPWPPNDPGACSAGNVRKEAEIARRINPEFIAEGNRRGYSMHDSTQSNGATSGQASAANNFGAVLAVSHHLNAPSTGTGIEVFHHPNTTAKNKALAARLSAALAAHYGLHNRGAKPFAWNFLVVTNMPALIIEHGFVGNDGDMAKVLPKIDSAVKIMWDEIAKDYPLSSQPPAPPPVDEQIYRVRKSWTDVASQIGAYKVLENAIVMADANPGYKVFDEQGKVVYEPSAGPVQPPTGAEPIMGKAAISAEAMTAFTRRNNVGFNPEIAAQFIRQGEIYGVRGDVAFCQAIHETGWFKYGGDVNANQNNFGGIGATGNGNQGNVFPTIEIGAKAHIQHLFAYASKDPLPAGEAIVDPRFGFVTRGVAPNWVDLNGRWAVPGTTYGQAILKIYGDLIAYAATFKPDPPVVEPPVHVCPDPRESEEYIKLFAEYQKSLNETEDITSEYLTLADKYDEVYAELNKILAGMK